MLFDIKIFRRKYFRNLLDVYVKKKHSFSSLFSGCNVHFGLEISSVEVSLVYFSIFSIVSVFLAFKTYLILNFFVIVICNPQRSG